MSLGDELRIARQTSIQVSRASRQAIQMAVSGRETAAGEVIHAFFLMSFQTTTGNQARNTLLGRVDPKLDYHLSLIFQGLAIGLQATSPDK
jgi:hypothetical protein